MFKVGNKDTNTTLTTAMASFWCLYCQLGTYFTPCSNVFIVNFEQVNAGWIESPKHFSWKVTVIF